jgi:hypothetical protein
MRLIVAILLAFFLAACTASTTSVKETPATEERERDKYSGGVNPTRHHTGKTPGQLGGGGR